MDDKPQTEVTQESREALALLELDRRPRPEKMRLERAYFDGAHEVRFSERTFRPRHGADLDDIRAFVDSLEVRPRAVAPLPEPTPSTHVEVRPRVPEHYRAPLERAIAGALVSVETVHRIGTGTVVDVAWEGADEGERRGLYIIQDDEARPYVDVTTQVDALAPPTLDAPAEPAPAAPAAPPAGAASRAAEEKKRRLGFGKKKDATPPAAAADDTPAPEGEKKRRFGFGKK